MNKYDCIIIGDDVYSLMIGLFLSRKMRKILLINQPSPYRTFTDKISVELNKKEYLFDYNHQRILTGLDEGGLTSAYLEDLGLLDELDVERLTKDYIINKTGIKKSRSNTFNELKIYLMRYYPEKIKEIKLFFNDLDRHYTNYKEQYINLLHNDDYTLSSLMVEWGDQNLYDLLYSYFHDAELVKEFRGNAFINGLDLKKVSTYNFFCNYFIGLKSGFYHFKTPIETLREKLLEKIKTSTKHSIINTKIINIATQGQKITHIEDSSGERYSGKYYFVSDQPIEFYNDFFIDLDAHIKKLRQYYPYIEDTSVQKTMYIAFEQSSKVMGVDQLFYYYQDHHVDQERIIKIFNYSMYENHLADVGKICVDFTYDRLRGFSEENILDKLFLAFPKLKWAKLSIAYGEETPYLAMMRDHKIRKLSVNELIDYESLNHIVVYDNLYIGGAFIRPESGLFGKIHQAIVIADKIEDNLYFKDEAEDYYYSNDEVMMMLRQNFDPSYFSNREIHINLRIGKSSYYLRIRGKNIDVYKGYYSRADLSIYTSNDRLIDIIYKRTPYQDIVQSDFFRYVGSKDMLKSFIKAFDFDDRHDIIEDDRQELPFKYFGVTIFNTMMFLIGGSALLYNYFPSFLVLLPAFILLSLLFGLKYYFTKKINLYEIIILLLYLGLGVGSIWMDALNQSHQDHLILTPMAIILFASVIFNRPIVFKYLKYDYSKEYIRTSLFKAITNGISFIWGFIMLITLFGPFFSGEDYASVYYYFIVIGILASIYYPSIYIKTSIKKS